MSPDDLPDLLTARELDHLVQTDPTAALRAAHRWLSGARTDDHALQAAATNALARSLFELGDVERAAAAARSAAATAKRAAPAARSTSPSSNKERATAFNADA